MAPEATVNHNAPAAPSAPAGASVFISKISSIPIVTSAVDVARSYYDETKNRFVLVQQVEKELVERVVPQVVQATAKVTPQSAQRALVQLDQYAANGLEVLGSRVPIIMEPTPMIIESGKKLVQETVLQPVSGLVEKALVYSEEKVELYLPAAPSEQAAGEGEAPQQQQQEQAAVPKDTTIARAQKLGSTVSQRLSTRVLEQVDFLRKLTPQDLQRLLSTDLINRLLATAEQQIAWLKANLGTSRVELFRLVGLAEAQIAEFRKVLTSAIASLEKALPGTLKDTIHSISIQTSSVATNLAEQSKALLAKIPAVEEEPHVKKVLETLRTSLEQIQQYSQPLVQSLERILHFPAAPAREPQEVELQPQGGVQADQN